MGNTCCAVDSNPTSILLQSDFEPNDQILTLELGLERIKFIKDNQLSTWRNMSDGRYYCGKWVDGRAEGLGVLYYPKNTFYQGQFQKGTPNGQGTLFIQNQEQIYEGEFLDGKAHGRGKLTHPTFNIIFQGEWFNSKPESGIVFPQAQNSAISQIKIDNFQSNQIRIIFKDQAQYEGEADVNLQPSGRGKLIYSQKSPMIHYEGDWEQGMFHGFGKCLWKDGSSYQGNYSYGKKQGQGKFIFSSKNYYLGHWLAGQKHGRGILYSHTNSVIKQGIWQKGNFLMSLTDEEMASNDQKPQMQEGEGPVNVNVE